MYNNDVKTQYMNEAIHNTKDTHRAIVTHYFDLVGESEQKLNKDICNWNTTEILDFYKSLYSPSTYRLDNINNCMTRYARWCLNKGFIKDGINHFEDINYQTLLTCVNVAYAQSRVVSREDVLSFIDNPVIQNAREKYVILGIFEGFHGKDISDLVKFDCSFDGNVALLPSGRKIEVSNKLKELCYEAKEETTYYTFNGKELNYQPSEYCYKNAANFNGDYNYSKFIHNINNRFIAISNLFESNEVCWLQSKTLNTSGMLHMIKEYIKENNIHNPTDAFNDEEFKKKLIERYCCSSAIASKKRFMERFGFYFEGM